MCGALVSAQGCVIFGISFCFAFKFYRAFSHRVPRSQHITLLELELISFCVPRSQQRGS